MTRNDFIAQVVQVQRDYEATNRKANLIRAFRMGDCINKVVEKHIYKTLQAACMEAADSLDGSGLSSTNLQSMYRTAIAFDEPCRKLLLDKCVSFTDAKRIASMPTDKRNMTVESITRYKAPTPFRLKAKPYKRADPQPDNTRNPDYITIAIVKHGDIDEDAVLNVLKNILTRVGLSRAGRLWERAQREIQA